MDLSRRNDELLGQLEDVAIFAAGTPVRSGLEDAEIGAADAESGTITLQQMQQPHQSQRFPR